jgi:hypothetical protein
MNTSANGKATFVEVFSSIKFPGKRNLQPSRPWPRTGFAVNKSTHVGEALTEDGKLVRSSN